jgi:hypothetical protein
MGKVFDGIDEKLAGWIAAQHMFFVATAPREGGHVNLSPKGLDSFAILEPKRVAYLDLVGSGAETIAHLRENGRITFMFCAFEGLPRIVRLHGRGETIEPGDPEFALTDFDLRPQDSRLVKFCRRFHDPDPLSFAAPKGLLPREDAIRAEKFHAQTGSPLPA